MNIKYCVWDVGQVIYPYTLNYLNQWALSKTTDKAAFIDKGGVKKFNYNPYMSGEINDEQFCQNLCQEYNIPFDNKTKIEINKALHQGVGKFFTETIDTMEFLSKQGIENCILSNALPMLQDTAPEQVKSQFRFASYKLKLLKPNPQIYEAVRRQLGCDFKEMIFIDDKEKNVLSAQSLGINGIVFNKNTIKKDCQNIIQNSNFLISTHTKER